MVHCEDLPEDEDVSTHGTVAVSEVPASSQVPASVIPPGELKGLATAESVRVSFERGEVPDTHRFLRMLQKLSLGLGAQSGEAAALAEKRLFAVPLWMEKIRDETGLDLWIGRAFCSLVVIFHRRGALASAFRVSEELQARNCEIPTCTYALLIDLSLREGRHDQAAELLDQSFTVAKAFIQSAPDVKESSMRAPTLAVEGLPSWVSNRDGHLVSLIAAQLAVIGCLPLMQVSTDIGRKVLREDVFAPPSRRHSSVDALAMRALRQGLELLRDAVGTGASGPTAGLERRMCVAKKLLVRPCVQFVISNASSSSFTGAMLQEILSSFNISNCADCPEVEAFMSGHTEQLAESAVPAQPSLIDDQDRSRALHKVLGVVSRRRKASKAPVREDFDELLRSAGKSRASGVVLAAFEAMETLAMHGSSLLESAYRECANRLKDAGPLRQISEEVIESSPCAVDDDGDACGDEDGENGDGDDASPCMTSSAQEPQNALDSAAEYSACQPLDEPPNLHLLPDADTFAAAIEGLFTARDASAALRLYGRCCRETLPNPAVFSAVIFGCLALGDGDGAVAALAKMEDHGFAPHARFLQRFLRHAGRFHLAGLRAISQHSVTFCTAARQALYHALMEACASSDTPSDDGFLVYQTMLSDSLQANCDTYFALLRAVSGSKDEQSALSDNLRFQERGALPPHPSFECALRECYENGERRRRAGLIMDSRRRWIHQICNGLTDKLLEDLRAAVAEAKSVIRKKPDYSSTSDILCAWLLPAYVSVLPMDSCAVHAAQYLVARYYLLRSGEEKAALQTELDEVICSACARKPVPDGESSSISWDVFAFVVRVILQLRSLDTPESAQVRLVRMLSGAAWRAGACFLEAHAIYVEQRAASLLPDVLSELIDQCGGPYAERPLYAGEHGKRQLAELVARRYLMRGQGEPVKLSVTIRFIRAHGLAHYIEDGPLFNPLIACCNSSNIQYSNSLCADDMELKCRLAAYAIGRGERRLAGRLIERLDVLHSTAIIAPTDWCQEAFVKECRACVLEAEEVEARELRAANAKRIAVDDDSGCLQLPNAVAEHLLLVDSEAALSSAADAFANCFGKGADGKRLLGLDVEWRPTLEKRGGMQKHRRSGQAGGIGEPCSTLQVASEEFVAVFDLLALAGVGVSASAALSEVLGSFLKDPQIVKLGFGLRQDILRLATSYPHLPCFRHFCSVLDVQDAWFNAAAASDNKGGKGAVPSGLSALCSQHLGAPLSKRLQTSDWGARPLSREQLLYAALDAHCLIGLAKALPQHLCSIQHFEVRPSASGQLIVHVLSDSTGDVSEEEEVSKVDAQIASKGQEIRAMKSAGAPKSAIQAEVAALLQLKDRFRELTGVEWAPSAPVVASAK